MRFVILYLSQFNSLFSFVKIKIRVDFQSISSPVVDAFPSCKDTQGAMRQGNCKLQVSFLWWYYIKTLPPLYSANAKRKKRQTDIVVLHMGINDILNAESDKDLIAESVTDIAKECWV